MKLIIKDKEIDCKKCLKIYYFSKVRYNDIECKKFESGIDVNLKKCPLTSKNKDKLIKRMLNNQEKELQKYRRLDTSNWMDREFIQQFAKVNSYV